jgi:NAD(P)-dependent dehydrogenase (short-subunit alcohol dehydrogenase family)
MQRVVLITGANRGIGLETARQMAKLDYHVIVASRDQVGGRRAADELGASFFPLDVTSPDSRQAVFDFVRVEFGRLDALVNNAGIMLDESQGLLNLPEETLRLTLETNAFAPLALARLFIPMMVEQNYGRVVNVSSRMAQIGQLNDYAPSYRLSKLLLNGMTRILADALRGKNVLVNAVCPGWVRSDMGGAGAPRSLEQGAGGIVWAATLPEGAPSGGFFYDGREIVW